MNAYIPRRPLLIETGSLSYLNEALKSAHLFKKNYTNLMINIAAFSMFLIIIGFFLAYSYRGTPSPEEVAKQNHQKQQYVMSKISECARYKQQQIYENDGFDDTPDGWNDLL